MKRCTWNATSLADTQTFGRALADALPTGAVVALIGTLGAGKTHLVQAIAVAAGVDRKAVTSPTFVLIHEYQGRVPIYHFDAYRIADDDEFLELGPEEYFDSEGWTFVEWADRVEACLPLEYLEVRLEITGPEQRRIEVAAHGSRYEPVLEVLAKCQENSAS